MATGPNLVGVGFRLGPFRRYVLHGTGTMEDGFGKADRPPDGGGLCKVGHGQGKPASKEADGDAAGDIARAADQDHGCTLLFFLSVYSLNRPPSNDPYRYKSADTYTSPSMEG